MSSDIITAAALVLRAYEALAQIARAHGMDDEQFMLSVDAEVARLDSWIKLTNAREDAVFDAQGDTDR